MRLKDEDKKLTTLFTPTEDTQRMAANLRDINQFIADDHWIDILISDEEFERLSKGRLVVEEEDGFGDRDDRNRGGFDLLYDRSLYRVFNNNDFGQGGRFYGGWWQNIKSDYRKFITINWYPIKEVDYSGMQVAMLYAMEGDLLDGDPYV